MSDEEILKKILGRIRNTKVHSEAEAD
jgi:hypothetical protein